MILKYAFAVIGSIGGIKALFVRFCPIRKFSGIPIISYYVNFQEFMSIFKGILLQMRKEKGEKCRHLLFQLARALQDLALD